MNMFKAEAKNLFKLGHTTGLALVMLMGAPSMASAQTSEIVEHEDGIRDFCLSRGLGDVYKRQPFFCAIISDT